MTFLSASMTDSTILGKVKVQMMPASFWEQAATSLRFEYDMGAVTPLAPEHAFDWRVLPSQLVMQTTHAPSAFEMEDGSILRAEAAEVICVAPGIRHRTAYLVCEGNTSRWSHINFWLFEAVNLATLFPMTGIIGGAPAVRLGDINAELADLYYSPDSKTWPVMMRRQALGFEIAALLGENLAGNIRDLSRWQMVERLLPALTYIEAHLGETMNRAELAKQVHLSPSHFATLFKEALGVAPGDYARQQQLRRAQQLLLSSTLGIAQIAHRCGFGNEFHFSRFFKAHLGVSPSHYRRDIPRSHTPGN